jgi:uncharacterized membrane protein
LGGYHLLALASLSFVGSHFLMSHPLRRQMAWRLGNGGFTLVYSAVSLATLYWMIVEFGRAPKAEPYWPAGDVVWVIASVLTLIASVLFCGSLVRNPSFPGMPDGLAAQDPFGVFRVTRHPMMWSFALWGIAHILVAPRPDNFLFAGSIVFLALVGAKAQEWKKAKLVGVQWDAWLRKTSYGLRLSQLPRAGVVPWVAGIALWFAATWAHAWMGAPGAGVFRWWAI